MADCAYKFDRGCPEEPILFWRSGGSLLAACYGHSRDPDFSRAEFLSKEEFVVLEVQES